MMNQDPLLLLTALLMVLGAMCLLLSIVYNADYMRKYQADFYQLFKGRAWVKGASFDYPSYRVVGAFILNYMVWKSILRFKAKNTSSDQKSKTTSSSIFIGSGILEKDVLKFENIHAKWLSMNIRLHVMTMCCTVWMFIYALVWLD